ncbi:protein AHNAK2 [Lates japonicus]|uniref:Protein AHNAK2 n=1 Tax=Lates japonicus TaxID=270547 RepID=A0AAD3NL30_LATJO|nr:protein AHNAK2 [Lates japonicus]
MPKFGIKMPKVKGPEFDLSLSKKDVDVTLPEAKAEGKLPEAPETDASLGNVDVSIPPHKMELKKPELEIKPLQTEGALDGQGSKFKMPKLGITMSKVKGPEIDFSLSKKDVDVTLPEAKAEIKLPDVEVKQPSAEVEIKPPEIKVVTKDTDGSPSKFKMPTFKLPKFGVGTQSVSSEVNVEGPDVDKDIKVDGADLRLPEVKAEVKPPDVEGVEGDQKKDVDVTLPEAKAEVQPPDVKIKQPSAKVEIKGPEIEAQSGNVEGSPSKFKMPSFTLPKFGASTPKDSVEVPDVDKDIKIDDAKLNISKEGAAVDVKAPNIDTGGLSVDVKTKGSETDGSGSKFKMPKFGISMPKVKGPEIDLSLSKKDVDVTLPEAKAEVQPPDVK